MTTRSRPASSAHSRARRRRSRMMIQHPSATSTTSTTSIAVVRSVVRSVGRSRSSGASAVASLSLSLSHARPRSRARLTLARRIARVDTRMTRHARNPAPLTPTCTHKCDERGVSWWRADDFCVHSALCRSLREYGNDRVYQLEDSGTSMILWNYGLRVVRDSQ